MADWDVTDDVEEHQSDEDHTLALQQEYIYEASRELLTMIAVKRLSILRIGDRVFLFPQFLLNL